MTWEQLGSYSGITETWTCPLHGQEYGGEDIARMGKWDCPACNEDMTLNERAWSRSWRNYHHWDINSGIPFRFRNRTLANWFREGKANEAIGGAADRFTGQLAERTEDGIGAVLLGPPGLGKTHLLCAIVACAIEQGYLAQYAVWPDVLTEVKNGFNLPRDESRRDIVGPLKRAPLLALDELALKPSASEFETGLLFEIIDHRYRERLPTLAATNATKETLSAVVGERIADRLTECSPMLVLTGASRRLRAAGPADAAFSEPQLARPPEKLVLRIHSTGAWRERVFEHRLAGRRAL